jgi:RNA:NAD 2'-phosphotransferase (TPT1/KptA family)
MMCAAGMYQDTAGQASCKPCPAGSTSSAGAMRCSFASAPAPPPGLTTAPIVQSGSEDEDSSTRSSSQLGYLGFLAILPVVAVVFGVKKFWNERVSKRNAASASVKETWFEFIGDHEIKARKFVASEWSAALGTVVHVELNPWLDCDCVAFQRFKNPSSSQPLNLNAHQYLWHGTPSQNIQSICQFGFDPAKRKNQRYGPGEYFGRNARTSDGYCGPADENGFKRLIVAIVLLPRTTFANANIAVVNNPTNSSESYALPLLVVTYGHTPTSTFVSAFQSGSSCTRVLYHQSTLDCAKSIIKGGFRVSRGQHPHLLAGEGVYFATHPRSTHRKARSKGAILRATVLVGRSMPVPFDGQAGLDHQAIVSQDYGSVRIPRNDWRGPFNTTENGAEYVVYDPSKIVSIALLTQQQFEETKTLP